MFGLVMCKLKALRYYGLGMLTKVFTFLVQTSLQLGSKLLKGLGLMSDDVNFLSQLFRDSMELQAQEALSKSDDREYEIMKPLQVLILISNVIIWSPSEHWRGQFANNFQYKDWSALNLHQHWIYITLYCPSF